MDNVIIVKDYGGGRGDRQKKHPALKCRVLECSGKLINER
jgi:hypothetical protein